MDEFTKQVVNLINSEVEKRADKIETIESYFSLDKGKLDVK
ncbi:hypothetical protein [Clostridium felsineum]|nr:hypothetical protein [Clostridium felsineum]